MSAITEVTKQKRLKKEELKKDLILLSRPIQMQVTLQSSKINYDLSFGQIIKQAREMQGLTCRELSELSGISESEIHRIESGKTKQPQLDTIRRLFQALKLDREKLISKGNEISYDLSFGQIIRQVRKIQGLTCKELSELSGISETEIRRIESGKRKDSSLSILTQIIQALKNVKDISKGKEINYDLPFGQLIKQAREMQGITRKKLSELSDISEDQILNIESGRTKQPYLDTIIRLTKALNLDSKRLISKGKEINYDLPIGQIIKQAREIQGLTCEKLSEISEISKSQTYSIESGKTKKPKLDTIIKLIQALNLDSKRVISKYNEINYDLPVGQIIRQVRKIQGLTCKELSKLSDISDVQINNIESGRTEQPHLDTIRRLFQALNLDSEKLILKNYDLPVGQIIRQAREMQGLTCKKLSEISEVSTAQIYSIESGKTKKPNLDTIRRLTQALNLDVEKLTSKCKEINYDLPVGQIIRQAREIQGLTCEKLSEISKICIAQIYDIELGKINPIPLDTLTQLTQALRLDSEKLILKNDKIQVGQIIRQARSYV